MFLTSLNRFSYLQSQSEGNIIKIEPNNEIKEINSPFFNKINKYISC